MPQTQATEAQIAEAAFYIWEAEGYPEGQSQSHWFKAIEVLKKATPKKKAAPKKAAAPKAAPKAKAPAKPRAKKAAAK